jgi:ribosomal protein S18 acetylase RimI-like enzyme
VTLEIRPLTVDDDLELLGQIVVDAYTALDGHVPEPEYEAEIADLRRRIATNQIFGAFLDGRPVGCVTYVHGDEDPHAEDLEPDEASFRMLGVDPAAQSRGVGERLVRACLDRAAAAGKQGVFIYSGSWMTAAHRLYLRMGFERTEGRDWIIDELGIRLIGFRRPL